MPSPKPKLPEDEGGSIFIDSKQALLDIEVLMNDYSTENAIAFLQKYYELWDLLQWFLSSSVCEEYDTEGSCLVEFYDKYAAFAYKLYYETDNLN